MRWLAVLGSALWLAHPYFSPRLIGTGDALWYHHLLADAVVQFRAGVFPVYVGQSEFMFNGAVYPHRVAPYHQYFAGLLDLLTGRTLGFFALQHLTILLSFLGGAAATYYACTRLAPAHRRLGAFLAVLYVACPGVMGLAFAQDLYMSVMAIPWVPLALGGAWLSFRENSWRALGMIIVGLGMLWWSHPPIAMWTTVLVGLQQLVRLIVHRRLFKAILQRGLAGVAILALLVAYPFVSAMLLRAPGESVVPYTMDRALLLQEIQNVFPANIRPLDPTASPLSQLQLGYSLWFILFVSVAIAAWRRHWPALIATSMAVCLLILVMPVPGITRSLWLAFPEPVVGLSLYWPMQRLLIIAAALLVVGLSILATTSALLPRFERALTLSLTLALFWSLGQAYVFHRVASERAAANADSAKWSRPENVTPMRHAYHLFGKQPETMSHGVMDPEMESRLLDPVSMQPMPDQTSLPPWQPFTGTIDDNPGILNLHPSFTLLPGRRYRLAFSFFNRDYTGVLQILGPGFFREYTLPSSGNPQSFGSTPEAARQLSLWTSDPQPVEVRLRFIPTQPGTKAESFTRFARFAFYEATPSSRPVELRSLIPYQVVVRPPSPAILETPRMTVPGYRASVGGVESDVVKTARGLVGVSVPSGESEVRVWFAGTPSLRFAFWLSACSWLLLLPLLWRLHRHAVDPSTAS